MQLARLGDGARGEQLREEGPQIRQAIGPGPYEDDRNLPGWEVLLVRQVLIRRDEHVKGVVCSVQELAV
jgi:hypothetical protein